MKDIIAVVLGLIGFMMIAGSAGDCDGACMDQANSLFEMFLIILGGLAHIGAAVLVAKWGDKV